MRSDARSSTHNPIQIIDCTSPYKLVKGRHGWFLVNPDDVYLGRAVFCYGESGEMEWLVIDQLLLPGFDAIEVGANIGTHTVSMARKLAGMGRQLLAVEPQAIVFQNLCANIALNGLFNVLAENAACSDKLGWLTFQSIRPEGEINSGGVSMREDGSGNQRVRALPLDELIPPHFRVGLIKIDVEGFEQKVLEGALRTLDRFRPILYLENDRIELSQALIEWLWRADYKLWWHTPELFNPQNFAGRKDDIWGNVLSCNMVAMPREAKSNLTGFVPVEDSSCHPGKRD